jgi:NAD+ kinase
VIHVDAGNPKAAALAERLAGRVPEDLQIVVGGDGFLLAQVAQHGLGGVWLGLNTGRLGFLLNEPGDDVDLLVERLRRRAYTVRRLSVLDTRVVVAGRRRAHRDVAVNDLYLERSSNQVAHLALDVDGVRVVDSLACDGLVLASPLGSTAYAFSAGGPPVHPELDAIVVAPICPHAPRLRPFVLHGDARVRVVALGTDKRPIRAVVDGRPYENALSVGVRLRRRAHRLAWFDGEGGSPRMVRKVLLA